MKDYWEGRFEPATEAGAYGVRAMRRRCCICGAMPLVGCESAHARSHQALTLEAFDSLVSAARRERMDRKAAIEQAARSAL
jgi:hypothetical protein